MNQKRTTSHIRHASPNGPVLCKKRASDQNHRCRCRWVILMTRDTTLGFMLVLLRASCVSILDPYASLVAARAATEGGMGRGISTRFCQANAIRVSSTPHRLVLAPLVRKIQYLRGKAESHKSVIRCGSRYYLWMERMGSPTGEDDYSITQCTIMRRLQE